jgi:hypothetical protein
MLQLHSSCSHNRYSTAGSNAHVPKNRTRKGINNLMPGTKGIRQGSYELMVRDGYKQIHESSLLEQKYLGEVHTYMSLFMGHHVSHHHLTMSMMGCEPLNKLLFQSKNLPLNIIQQMLKSHLNYLRF